MENMTEGLYEEPELLRQIIEAAIKNVIDIAGDDGGLILATDHSFHQGILLENVSYFMEKARELGRF